MESVLVTGAGGFIGHHLVTYLLEKGYRVRGVDIQKPEYTEIDADEFLVTDLREYENYIEAVDGVDHIYALAADMGGMGFISQNHAQILRNNSLIHLHTLEAAHQAGVSRYLYAPSACIYPQHLQEDAEVTPLKEEDAYPTDPQDAYGWEKLVSEQAVQYYTSEYGLDSRIVRFHNIYGPYGTYDGGRQKAPAAICCKVASISDGMNIEIWGDGEQTRSFCHIEDCVEGLYRLMMSDYQGPLNLGTDELVSINQLAELAIAISGKKNIGLDHVDGPQGVRGRNSDNTRLLDVLGWEPTVTLAEGLTPTYQWIESMVGAP